MIVAEDAILPPVTVTNDGATSDITVSITGLATLGGTTRAVAVTNGGEAVFNDLTVEEEGTYTLIFMHVDSGVMVVSSKFTVIKMPAITSFYCSSTGTDVCSLDSDALMITGNYLGSDADNIGVNIGVGGCLSCSTL